MYDYDCERPKLFTDEGQRKFLQIRDRANDLLAEAGAARLQEIISRSSGDTWFHLACVDRLVELKELREIPQNDVAGQHRVFVRA